MSMEKWLIAAKKADFNKWSRMFGIDPVLARIIRNRDITEEAEVERYLHGTMQNCYSPWLLAGMEEAAALIRRAVENEMSIRVIGDYDVDGICSSYILTEGLRCLGARVDTAIPHRIRDGYGLNDTLIQEAVQDGIRMIITCDNGIAAAPQIAMAKENGILTVVTDHHEVPFVEEDGGRREILPPADAVVDPKQKACGYPFPGICGAVVAYKLIQALCERMGDSTGGNPTGGKPGENALLRKLLPFAAMATVCDVMELKDENRIIVREGLRLFRETGNPGLRALAEVNGLDLREINSYHLGFVLGPCMNATGRLDTARRALELLESRTKVEAYTAATELKELNDSRKNMTLRGVEQAERQIAERHLERDKVMIIFLPEVHESLAGIIAGRIRERYHKPVFVLTKGEEGVKGSGRSIEAYHMYQSMAAVEQYFIKFGGHRQAAGLSMREEDIESLREALNRTAELTEEDFIPRVHIDVPMPMSYARIELARQMEVLEPFGAGNPKPLFAQKDVRFVAGRRIGADGQYARFTVLPGEGEERAELMYFGDLEAFMMFLEERYGVGSAEELFSGRGDYPVSITYQIGINSYQGRERLQYIMQNYC